MVSRFVLSISTLVLLVAAGGVQADTFRQIVADDGHVCNDTQYGPTQAYNTTAVHVRSIASRRRVGYMRFDISALKTSGKMLSNVCLDLASDGSGRVAIYGVIESQEKITIPFTQLTWSMAPGVPNNPLPAVDSPVTLDRADLVGPLVTVQIPAVNSRVTTDPNKAMDAFFNSDTNGSVLLLLAPAAEGQSALIWSIRRNTTDCAYLVGQTVAAVTGGASNPSPADKATDVYVGATLSWTPGTYAATHNVYLGTSFADVNTATADKPGSVSVSLAQDANTYDPTGNLKYGQTYYWRVDEVNGPPDRTVYRGNVWSFTTEPLLYPVKGITATASSSEAIAGPEQTINGSGLTGDLHSTTDTTMWVSSKTGSQPAWIRYEFDKVYRLREMWVWNYNNAFEAILGFGFKDVTVEYSTNGADWTLLKDVQFAQGPAQDSYAHNTTVDFSGLAAKYVRLTAKTNWGGIARQCGLSEVRFLYVPTYASNPAPAAAQTGVSPDVKLEWRSGREAATHQVYVSADKQAVADGKVLAGTTAETIFDPGSLDLAKTYYWKIGEVNQATAPSTWQGDVWSFTTIGYLVVDDFESYNDDKNRIYDTWIDGYGTKTNGSQVGYSQAPFAERTTVHGGKQAMPLTYNNSTAAYSEAERTLNPAQDWTIHGAKTLSLYFYGPAANKGGQLYLKVGGKKVAYAGAAGDLNKAQWVQWTVDLASLGVNLKKVTSLVIGVDGAAASGVLYIDDVQLRP